MSEATIQNLFSGSKQQSLPLGGIQINMKMSSEVVTTDRTRDESPILSFPTLEIAMASREEFLPCRKETVKEKEKFIGKRIHREG